VVDAQGRIVPNAGNLVHFHVEGGKLLGVGNGDPASHDSDLADQRSLFSGYALIIIQAPRNPGRITLTADSPGLTTAMSTLNVDATSSHPTVP
jgi:beta-galactosidase